MENASKALIIAGAILLAILIIGLGVFIYNQAANTVSDTGMDQIAVRQFNAQFEPYIMNNASGATAMALYDTVNAYNATVSRDQKINLYYDSGADIIKDRERFPEVEEARTMSFKGFEGVEVVKLAAKKAVAKDDDEKPSIIDEPGIRFAKSELSAVKKYNIEVTRYDGGVIRDITISPAGRIKVDFDEPKEESCK